MGEVINYLEYLKAHNLTDRSIKRILVMVEHLHPKVEALIDQEISRFSSSKEVCNAMRDNDEVRSLFDVTLITSLCFILAQYLISLANRPNNLNVNADNIDVFAINLIQGMIKTFEKKLDKDE